MIQGNKLGKNRIQMRSKFLSGFPPSFEVVLAPEKLSRANGGHGTYVYPAAYANYWPAAMQGANIPHAGQCDLHAMPRAFYEPWAKMIKDGLIKQPPSGSVHRIQNEGHRLYQTTEDTCHSADESETESETHLVANKLSATQITKDFV